MMRLAGVMRRKYSETVEVAPSRFGNPEVYADWAARADVWADIYLQSKEQIVEDDDQISR